MDKMNRTYPALLLGLMLLTACGYDGLLPPPKGELPRVVITPQSDLTTMINIMQPDSAEQEEVVASTHFKK